MVNFQKAEKPIVALAVKRAIADVESDGMSKRMKRAAKEFLWNSIHSARYGDKEQRTLADAVDIGVALFRDVIDTAGVGPEGRSLAIRYPHSAKVFVQCDDTCQAYLKVLELRSYPPTETIRGKRIFIGESLKVDDKFESRPLPDDFPLRIPGRIIGSAVVAGYFEIAESMITDELARKCGLTLAGTEKAYREATSLFAWVIEAPILFKNPLDTSKICSAGSQAVIYSKTLKQPRGRFPTIAPY